MEVFSQSLGVGGGCRRDDFHPQEKEELRAQGHRVGEVGRQDWPTCQDFVQSLCIIIRENTNIAGAE